MLSILPDLGSPIIRLARAKVRRGRNIVFRIDDIAVSKGEHLVLLGGNGSGKNLLASLLTGQCRESAIYVSFDKCFVPSLDVHNVSFEEQRRLLLREKRFDVSEYDKTARDEGTSVYRFVSGARVDQDKKMLFRLLDDLDLSKVINQGIRYLSSGQLRRAQLARGLYSDRDGFPQLLVLDNVLESIDRESERKIRDTLSQVRNTGQTVIELCRRPEQILDGADRLVLLKRDGFNLCCETSGAKDDVIKSSGYKLLVKPQLWAMTRLKTLLGESRIDSYPVESFIKLRNINASYGTKNVLRNFSWSMTSENNVLIEGPNGCGKSTLLSLIDGENHMAYGQEVYLFGRLRGSGETIWETKANFGVVSNEIHYRYLQTPSVIDVVVSGFFDSLGLYSEPSSKQIEIGRLWLRSIAPSVGFTESYAELSFGQQRLVLLARAMVKLPRVLILDEACVGLDDEHIANLINIIDTIAKSSRTRILYVSHENGPRPKCLNKKLSFVENADRSFSVVESDL